MSEIFSLNVFLCHANEDRPTVRRFYNKLRTEQWINPWLDSEKIDPGQNWKYEIEDFIENIAHVIIVFLSTRSVTKTGYVQNEIRKALERAESIPEGEIFIIPVRLDECNIPKMLLEKKYQYEDYYKHRKRSYDRILQSLKSRAKNIGISTDISIVVMKVVELIIEPQEVDIACFILSKLLNVNANDIVKKDEEENVNIRLIVGLTERAVRDLELEIKNRNSDYYRLLKYVRHRILDSSYNPSN